MGHRAAIAEEEEVSGTSRARDVGAAAGSRRTQRVTRTWGSALGHFWTNDNEFFFFDKVFEYFILLSVSEETRLLAESITLFSYTRNQALIQIKACCCHRCAQLSLDRTGWIRLPPLRR